MTASPFFDAPTPRTGKFLRGLDIVCGCGLVLLLGLGIHALAQTGQLRGELWAPFLEPALWRLIGRGFAATLRALIACTLLSFVAGLLLAALGSAGPRWLRTPLRLWVELFRAIPSLLILLFVFFTYAEAFNRIGVTLANGLGDTAAMVLGLDQLQTLGPLIVALTLYHGALCAEIIRAGLNAIPRGQMQAARALGMTSSQAVRLILLPQALHHMRPALLAEAVRIAKATALGYAIGYQELLRTGQIISTAFHNVIAVSLVMMLIYGCLCGALSWLASSLARTTPGGRLGSAS
ncbi:MAG: hypothetical protein CGU28_01125 [Candidatus Dactylopiibacterium carminicum]|uniref:Amino acid ABC transporter permease n=1 Tax=Candidatus Dactylopiibacterium carminicum TaxID=857335 RepID=A0A272EX97_9RHOO|nr:amino acid ABC transporter permease [Candidatus Dactylopiibacterium carminicum]KAF7599623.1 amino acid ABC transporter permease [Candidatus Dactylopiibacterium carminicum]PAS94270.1 MAG: hypothetical protein CGU29_04470 [Candidatus Dactylopiibacterium carminicum]PAS98466.1 MAG: hypothetical protein CGU28_01125 [Candidatus Dactylopiibacterium carminicum]PAS99626.1 MAG: hypothetical protein BSR46_07140 [Candidatus Dactylopiibacterium carminicum]